MTRILIVALGLLFLSGCGDDCVCPPIEIEEPVDPPVDPPVDVDEDTDTDSDSDSED